MKAVVYRGPREVRVESVPDAKIESPTDVLIKIHSSKEQGWTKVILKPSV